MGGGVVPPPGRHGHGGEPASARCCHAVLWRRARDDDDDAAALAGGRWDLRDRHHIVLLRIRGRERLGLLRAMELVRGCRGLARLRAVAVGQHWYVRRGSRAWSRAVPTW